MALPEALTQQSRNPRIEGRSSFLQEDPSLVRFGVAPLGFRPEGAATHQPRAMPWELENVMNLALKGPNMVFNPTGTALHLPLRQGACPCYALPGLCRFVSFGCSQGVALG